MLKPMAAVWPTTRPPASAPEPSPRIGLVRPLAGARPRAGHPLGALPRDGFRARLKAQAQEAEMARRARIALLRARHDPSVPTITDQACLDMFFHNGSNTAVFDYWQRVTRGWLDFRGSELMPWVDIALTPAEAGKRAVEAIEHHRHENGYSSALEIAIDGRNDCVETEEETSGRQQVGQQIDAAAGVG